MSREEIFKLDPVSELEMWMSSLNVYFRYHAGSFAASERVVSLDKNFCEELRTVGWILEKVQDLLSKLVLVELADVKDVRWEALSARGIVPQELSKYRNHTAVAGRLISMIETVNDFRTIVREKLDTGVIPFVFFRSLGRLLNREFRGFRKNRSFLKVRQQHVSSDWQRIVYRDLFTQITSVEMRLETMALFSRMQRILSAVDYVRVGLRSKFNYRVFMALFYQLQFQGTTLLQRMERWAMTWEVQAPTSTEIATSLLFAMNVEMKRVFRQELAGIENEQNLGVIYGRMETAAGLLWNCYQNIFIAMARSFHSLFNEHEIFSDLAARQEESVRLLNDLCTIREMTRCIDEIFSLEAIVPLRKTLHIFSQNSMRSLMFKDWGLFEGFIEQLKTASPALSQVVHRFSIFLDTLIAAVEKRAVLRALDAPEEEEEVESG
jgi:hypothetical protein